MASGLIRHFREWLLVLAIALPVVISYIVADRTTGWASATASVFMFVAVVCLIAVGIAHEFWAWRKVLNDDDQPPPADGA